VLLKCVTNKSFVDIVAKITDIRKTMVNELYQELPITAKIVDKYKDAIIGADLLRISWALHFLTLDEFDNWVSRLSSRKDALPQSAKKG
jgi:hypothetical protein